MRTIQLTQGHSTIVCDCHYDLVKEFKWHTTTDGYARSNKRVAMHRLITQAPKGLEVDHINHNRLDNRCSNLKVVLPYHNRQFKNTGARLTNGRWYSSIKRGGKRYALGGFDTKAKAIARYRTASDEYHRTGKITK